MQADVRLLHSLILHRQSVKGRVTLAFKYIYICQVQLDKARDYLTQFEILNLAVS